jgi:hypothetical protein
MSTVYGVNYTKNLDPVSSNITDPGELEGKVRVMTDTYEAVALALGSTIYMGKPLPVGARIIGVTLAFDALGAATISVGDAVSPARYIAATSVASAGMIDMEEGDKVDGLLNKILSTTNEIILTTAGAAITGTVKSIVKYVSE